MAAYSTEHVSDVRHWNDTLFSFKTTRDESLRFANAKFARRFRYIEQQLARGNVNSRFAEENVAGTGNIYQATQSAGWSSGANSALD